MNAAAIQRPILLLDPRPAEQELFRQTLHQLEPQQPVHLCLDVQDVREYAHRQGVYANRESLMPVLLVFERQGEDASVLPLLRELRRVPGWEQVPQLIFTETLTAAEAMACRAAGANALVLKPADYLDYCAVLGDICRFWLHRNHWP